MSQQPIPIFLLERLPELWTKTMEHIVLTGVSTFIAVIFGIPLGILISRMPALRGVVLGTAGIIQTIPSLALLAFLLPFMGVGAQPAILGLALYALLPIVRNTFTGITGVPKATLEAAEGLGFTSIQRLWIVEIPLAVPVIVAGIRTAAVICVGVATLSTFIGAGGLGDFINRGLALSNLRLTVLGAASAAVLALLIDYALGLVEEGLRPGRKPPRLKMKAVVYLCVIGILLTAMAWNRHGAVKLKNVSDSPGKAMIRIGTKNFTEQLILGELLAQMIEKNTDLNVSRVFNLGGTVICHKALTQGEIDLYPEYTGTGLTTVLKLGVPDDTTQVFNIVNNAYREKFACEWLSPFGYNNTYAITVRRSAAQRNHWIAISDLKNTAQNITAGFTSEFMERPDGYPGLQAIYGFSFGKTRDMGPELMYQAAAKGEVDVICAFATDGRIPAYDLQVLADDKHFFPPYHAATVVRQKVLNRYPQLRKVLQQLAGLFDDETMQMLNYEVDGKKRAPADVAFEFLYAHDLVN
jgi:osmoprotectant transport system permease protein